MSLTDPLESFALDTCPFGKELRLLKGYEFKAVFDQVDIKVGRRHYLCLSRKNSLGRPRLGLIIAKKHVKRAVDRNRIKRITRDSFRCHQRELPPLDLIFMARSGLGEQTNTAFHSELVQLWRKLRKQYYRQGQG